MTQEPMTLYKLIILYMLDRATQPLTKAQIDDFILEKEYTNYLTLQQAIAELCEIQLISTKFLSPDNIKEFLPNPMKPFYVPLSAENF